MPKTKRRRKQESQAKSRFRAALILAGLTMEQWAERNGITLGHLSQVLDGKRESRSLMEKVDTFAAKQLTVAA